METRKVELLAPAKNSAVALVAIRNGADAVYIGGPGFGARKAAGNSLEDIREVVRYAHRFYCRVFVTVNTILYDAELAEAEQLIRELYRMEVDAIIIQDPAILRLDIPPILLHASTQMHNYDLERIRFLDQLGFRRIVLARELSLEQVQAIRREVKAELEYFVHGALCVSLSGQCYLSHHLTGRSANRGECAQACRMKWTLADREGRVLEQERYLLSLKDLNLSAHLPALVAAGIDSFKIEGRLKDAPYVANVTNYYSTMLNQAIAGQEGIVRSSSGQVVSDYEPDPERSFNRGFSDYFLLGRKPGLINKDTPKSMGKRVAKVLRSSDNQLWVEALEPIHNADGLCYISHGELEGIQVNRAEGDRLTCPAKVNVPPGTWLYRNHDREFTARLEREGTVRKIAVTMDVYADNQRLVFVATDEDQVVATVESEESFEPATRPDQVERIARQLRKCGETDFVCTQVHYHGETVPFVQDSRLNHYRRELLQQLALRREEARERWVQHPLNDTLPYPGVPDWRLNVVNTLSRKFYADHGVPNVEAGFETGTPSRGRALMRCRFCLLFELGMCLKGARGKQLQLPLYLSNSMGRFKLELDCEHCFMEIMD